MTIKLAQATSRGPRRALLARLRSGLSRFCSTHSNRRYQNRIWLVSRFESKPFRKNILESNAGGEGEAEGDIPDRLNRRASGKASKNTKNARSPRLTNLETSHRV